MEFSTFQPSSWPLFFNPPLIFSPYISAENYVQWSETPDSHIYTADLPGVRKEEIKVEVEDSIYLIIKTEAVEPTKSFMRKFRLPSLINISGISAGYEDGVLTVTVPRSRRGVHINPADLPDRHDIVAPAA
ncbi:hypothetical protein AQUCO_07700019v1 [Aquilegia coerulea]|uniref:SHSP domain-containing protein n=1 Tax=Aquilegia coerulea TaxID=218851 RepID=A0A2G5C879_AQUCA|nr:hypothetical protein AQUCO_07700019v1 [Aquilegia coerulea]